MQKKVLILSLLFIPLLILGGCSGKKTSTSVNVSVTEDDSNTSLAENSNANENVNTNSATNSNGNVNSNLNTNTTANTNSLNTNSAEEDVTADENTNTAETVTDDSAQARDTQRVADVKALQTALELYNTDKQAYPDTFDGLVPTYLKVLPTNPTPGGSDYVYTPIGSLPAKFYDLSYTLEVGTDDVSAGQHIATPKGIAQP